MADEQHTESRIKPHHVVVAICALVLLVFAIANIDDVRVDFVFDRVDVSLVLVIFLCALLGFVIGWFVGRRRNND